MSEQRRLRRQSERDSKKLYAKIRREALEMINKMSPEELEKEIEKYTQQNGNNNFTNQASVPSVEIPN